MKYRSFWETMFLPMYFGLPLKCIPTAIHSYNYFYGLVINKANLRFPDLASKTDKPYAGYRCRI